MIDRLYGIDLPFTVSAIFGLLDSRAPEHTLVWLILPNDVRTYVEL